MARTPQEAREFVAGRNRGVLATIKSSDGRPQLSNVSYAMIDGMVRVSVTSDRAKTANVRKDPRVSLHVSSEDFWAYMVVEGRARLSAVAAEPGDGACRALLTLYETIRGEPHADPDEFFRAMVDDRRLELAIEPERYYPLG